MLKFLRLVKSPPNNQSPSAIPGYLFRSGREENGFVIIGECDPVQPFDNCNMGFGCQSGMGSAISTSESASSSTFHIDVKPSPENIDSTVPDQTSTIKDIRSSQRTEAHYKDSLIPLQNSNGSSPGKETLVYDSYADSWKDIPFQVSEKYIPRRVRDPELIHIPPIDWDDFQYDFSTEHACVD